MPDLVASGVQSLILRDTRVGDLRQLAVLPNLKVLDIRGTRVRDISLLATFAGLQSLNLQFLQIEGFDARRPINRPPFPEHRRHRSSESGAIEDLTKLRTLVVAVTRVADVGPLGRLTELTSLDLDNTWIRDIRPLAGMTTCVS